MWLAKVCRRPCIPILGSWLVSGSALKRDTVDSHRRVSWSGRIGPPSRFVTMRASGPAFFETYPRDRGSTFLKRVDHMRLKSTVRSWLLFVNFSSRRSFSSSRFRVTSALRT